MRKRSSKIPRDVNQLAKSIMEQATGETPAVDPISEPIPDNAKNPHAVALGKLGGLKGGKARAAKLSAKSRKEIARKAARARWAKNSE